MIRLTPKQIDKIMTEAGRDKVSNINMGAEWVALAQLKRVAEWGNEDCDCDVEREHPIHRHFCPKCWQALLEEVKEWLNN